MMNKIYFVETKQSVQIVGMIFPTGSKGERRKRVVNSFYKFYI